MTGDFVASFSWRRLSTWIGPELGRATIRVVDSRDRNTVLKWRVSRAATFRDSQQACVGVSVRVHSELCDFVHRS